jgi:hypothetical protein
MSCSTISAVDAEDGTRHSGPKGRGRGRDRVSVYVMPELRPAGLNLAAYSIRKVRQFLFPMWNALYATYTVCHHVPAGQIEVNKILHPWQKHSRKTIFF